MILNIWISLKSEKTPNQSKCVLIVKNIMMKFIWKLINLIIDMFAYLDLVYSAAKGLDIYWCKNFNVHLFKYDNYFYLEVYKTYYH